MYFSHLTAAAIAALGLLPKAALETWFFHDKASAKRTLLAWIFINIGIGVSFSFTLFIDYFG